MLKRPFTLTGFARLQVAGIVLESNEATEARGADYQKNCPL